jgi:hypothetical protein
MAAIEYPQNGRSSATIGKMEAVAATSLAVRCKSSQQGTLSREV